MTCEKIESESTLAALNNYLSNKSYIEGAQLSQADVAVFEAVQQTFDAKKYPHVARWFSHVSSKKPLFNSLSGTKKPVSEYGFVSTAAPKKSDADIAADLFGSDEEEDPEVARAKLERLRAYEAKKAAKGPAPVAKSIVFLDVKPWDDTTDLKEMETAVRSIQMDGLLWGESKLVPIGYGINKLQISCVIEDDKVGIDALDEAITAFEDYVQSVDVHSFNKV